jgi:hypothetical protein
VASDGEAAIGYDPAATPGEIRDQCLRDFSLRTVFTRDLAAAHCEGLITLGGLECPTELESCLIDLGKGANALDLLKAIESSACRVLAIEGVEYGLARRMAARARQRAAVQSARRFVLELTSALRLAGRTAVVNLNGPLPPSAQEAEGPLFADMHVGFGAVWLQQLALLVAESVLHNNLSERLQVLWHLGEADFKVPVHRRLIEVATLATQLDGLTFVFDRPRQDVWFGEGITRKRKGVLQVVGLNLPMLANRRGDAASIESQGDVAPAGLPARAGRFVDRLKCLAEMALSAAVQKRVFLRREAVHRPALGEGLRLERAGLMVSPLGLDDTVLRLTGERPCDGDEGRSVACAILARLAAVLAAEGRRIGLDTSLDATIELRREPAKPHLATIGELHAAAGCGACVMAPSDPAPTPRQLADWLGWAWKNTEVQRVRFLVARHDDERQLPLAFS